LLLQRPTPDTGQDAASMTRHVDPKSLLDLSERPDPRQNDTSPLSAGERPLTCTDGSLVIDADGRVTTATPQQRQIALAAKAARAGRAAVAKA
jgi:hypothetical protein